jgi:hypothetical protein
LLTQPKAIENQRLGQTKCEYSQTNGKKQKVELREAPWTIPA